MLKTRGPAPAIAATSTRLWETSHARHHHFQP
jgi:hypothetical protein